MVTSILKSTLLVILPLLVPSIFAFDDIIAPWSINAGKDVEVTIVNDISTGRKSFDAGFTHYRIYLATTPPGWGTGPVCVLTNDTLIDVETPTIQIPASVGPRSIYRLSTQEYNEDPYKDGPSGFEYSNDFDLKGATGEWGKAELDGHGIGIAEYIPCTAYSCVRKCNDADYPTWRNDTTKVGFAAYKKAYECMTSCEGVTAPLWSTWYGDDVDSFEEAQSESGGDEDDSSEESVGFSSTTISRAATTLSSQTTTSTSTSDVATASPTPAQAVSTTTGTSSSPTVATPTPSQSANSGTILATVPTYAIGTVFFGAVALALSY